MTAPPPAPQPRLTAVRSPSHWPSLDCDLGQGAAVARCGGAAEHTARQGKARVLGECALEKRDEERLLARHAITAPQILASAPQTQTAPHPGRQSVLPALEKLVPEESGN